ncbi:hypothetical protein [uncultured Pseudoflavonifractor sp.]|uniref:hypothetical protein n=1 Tax=uncultured Pseudoflavonifractor sp. TaxID=1221379 RepID=UPI0025F4D363|nr:hypothetical protein [uncultured Pseudoflavonifractor sp.]
MTYRLKAGVLYSAGGAQPLAHIRGHFCGAEKQVLDQNDSLLLRTDIRLLRTDAQSAGDVRCKEYVMYDADGTECAVARPCYADGDDPSTAGWPVCRMPRVGQAALTAGGQRYTLLMENVQNYVLTDSQNHCTVRIIHQGVPGGWRLDVSLPLSAAFLCGLFIFCRYLEEENEFVVV